MQKSVVILGIARSGTSVTSGILNILGVNMGNIRSPSRINPKGFYEDYEFNLLIQKMWRAAGAREKDTFWNPPDLKRVRALRNNFAKEIRELVAQKSQGKTLWGWKSPRTSIVIGAFLPHLKNPHVIVVLRNPLDIVQSATNSKHVNNKEYALKMVAFHFGVIMDFLARHPRIPCLFVSFEEVVADPVKEARKMANFLGVRLTPKMIARIQALVIPRSRIRREKLRVALLGDLPQFLLSCVKKPYQAPRRIFRAFRNIGKM